MNFALTATISKSLAILKNSSLESEKFIFLGHPWYVCMDSVIVKLQNL